MNFVNAVFTLVVISFLSVSDASATVTAATGFSSTTSGRPIPTLAAGFVQETWAVTASSTGVSTPLYYHSAWTLTGFRLWKSGEFGHGAVTAGLGLGLFFAKRGYRDTETSPLQSATDYNIGPAFRVTWYFLDPVFFSVESIFGARRPVPLIVLSAQDIATITFGVAF